MNRTITQDEESWIGSLINIGAIIGPLPFGFLSEKLGRKIALLFVALPLIIAYFILAFLHDIYWYYAARFISGISLGATCTLLPLYISEIAEDSNRGMLSVTLNIFWTFGNLLPYILGPYLPVMAFNITLACIPISFFILFILVAPESPYYLIAKGKIFKAEESLMKLRTRSRSLVGKELVNIQSSIRQDKNGTLLDLFKIKSNLKALGISLALISFQQLSGINVVVFYTQLIFQEAGSNIPPEISSIIVGVTLFASSLFIPFFADSFGRRSFLMISSSGAMICLAAFGSYFFMKEANMDVDSLGWLPIVSLVLYIVFFNVGYGPLPWTVSSELFPINMKAVGASLVSFTCWLISFFITKFFNDLNRELGRAGTFWLFAGFSMVATGFTWFYVPETKGKSFSQIQEILKA